MAHGCLEDTSVLSVLKVFHDNVLCKSTFYFNVSLLKLLTVVKIKLLVIKAAVTSNCE